ncbi:MAG: TIGR03621 family F420-dependent LLM class oxidoreductase [Chloroflexi bacterium]|nr:TIGR03621 family F420-dependent LLM class oxidoreductase [Chloroflexota bacterium]
MSPNRPFRFCGGLFWAESAEEWTDGARRLESAGYDTLVIGDHFSKTLAPIPALMAAASATNTLRLACTVFDNDFRHPAALAREVATVDVLSGGRFVCGIGAGWLKTEYDSVGIPFDSPTVRVSRFEEAVLVMKGLWSDQPLTFAGKHYEVTKLDGQPKPKQRPHPPIFIGGGGKRLLSFAAREADIVGIGPRANPGGGLNRSEETHACLAEKVQWVREAAANRFDQLELAALIWEVAITDDVRGAAEAIAARRSRPIEQVLESPFFLMGTIDAIVDKLLALREQHGISHISVFPSDTERFAPVVERLAGR